MFNNILSIKKLKKQLLSINRLIESFFNKFKFKHIKKSQQKLLDNRIALGIATILFLLISYTLIPTLYNKDKVKVLLKSQILEKFDTEVKFNDKIKYGLFPKPYFYSKNLTIKFDDKQIAKVAYTKVYISFKNFFFPSEITVKDLLFKEVEFKYNSKNKNFFKKILRSKKKENKVLIQDGRLFFEDKNKDVLFLLKIDKLNFFKDLKNQYQKSIFVGEIFNTPFSLFVSDDIKKRELTLKLKSKKIRLDILNTLNYKEKNINGVIDFVFINKENSFNYKILQNYIKFVSSNENFNGSVDFKPFYFRTNLNFNYLNSKKLFQNNSILINLINSGVLNNQNLNGSLNINFKKLDNNYLDNLKLKSYLDEGNYIIKDLSFSWNKAATINVNDIQIISELNDIKFMGQITFNFDDLEKFYSYYQVKRSQRQKLKKVKLDFIYELNKEKIILDNLIIDDDTNKTFNNFLADFNSKEKTIFNKVTFRNFVKDFFNSYEG